MTHALDVGQGIAKDYCEVFIGPAEEPDTRVVEIALEEDDQLRLSIDDVNGKTLVLWFPVDRIRALFKEKP